MQDSIKLRPYQLALIQQTAQKVAASKRVIMCAPTGSGKTVIFSTIIGRHLEKDMFNRVLVLTHRTELFSQTIRAVARTGTTVTELVAGQKTGREHSECRCLIAMVETLKRRDTTQFGRFSLVIVDEAHRADFTPILEAFPDTPVIGATATPISASKKRPLKNYYHDIAISVGINDLIEAGYLARPHHYKAAFDGSALRKARGEYTGASQFEAMGNKIVYDNLVELWLNHAGGKKTIVFNINKEHTLAVNERFRQAGVRSTAILSGDPDRDAKIAAFQSGKIQVLNNCEIATTGFDVPDIECVVMNRATASLPLWLQCVGRGSRTAPGKTDFTILDFGGNIDRHGLWHAHRDWVDIFHNPAKAGENPAPHRECPECGALMFASARRCPECEHAMPGPKEIERQKVRGYLEKVGAGQIEGARIEQLSIQQLYHLEVAGKYKPSYVARVARTRGEQALREYARMKGYPSGWVWHQLRLPTGHANHVVRL